MGCAETTIEPLRANTVAEVWRCVAKGEALPANLLMAVNMEYAAPDSEVRDGDEVAFFPPVTGGGYGG